MVAGEASGDVLGAGLIRQLKSRYPNARFEGIGGPQMIAEGFHTLAPMERLSVMGLVEVLGRLFELLRLRKRLVRHFIKRRPAVFIGIDAPDFNLNLEKQLKTAGIKTVQYVAPQVWAWRQERVKTIAQCADLILALFPFETAFYRQHNVSVHYVGHPLADQIPLTADKETARRELGLDTEKPVLTLLPGSRASEVSRLATTFLDAALKLRQQMPDCQLVVAVANDNVSRVLNEKLASVPTEPRPLLVLGKTREAMAAADVLLAASGTVTLEAALVKRPMVVAYKLARVTYWRAKRQVKVASIALPNLLMTRPLIPEFIQDEATPDALVTALLPLFGSGGHVQTEAFGAIHQSLRCNADIQAGQAVSKLIEEQAAC